MGGTKQEIQHNQSLESHEMITNGKMIMKMFFVTRKKTHCGVTGFQSRVLKGT